MIIDIVKVFLPSTIAFCIGIGLTPILTYYLYKYQMWKKESVAIGIDGREAPISKLLHGDELRKTPRMGGIVVWGAVLATTFLFFILSKLIPGSLFEKLDFFSRNQTWVPATALLVGALVGFIDDFFAVTGRKDHAAGGLSLKKRLLVVALVGLLCASWFYFKLDVSGISLPFDAYLPLGILFIPFFILVTMGIYSGGIIDGIDGLAGGIFATMFAAYAGIAFAQQQIDLAAFCAVIVGALLAFLWFNIPPARFYLSETGTMGLTLALAIVAFMTDELGNGHGVFVLPIIAFPLVLTTATVIIQLTSKKLRNGKKVFLVAPLHNHFQALGWPGYKVTMRFWIIGVVFAILGITLALIGR